MSVRTVTRRRLAAWQRAGGVRQTVADIVGRSLRNAMVVIGFSVITSQPSSIARMMYSWCVRSMVVTMTTSGCVSVIIRWKSAAR